MQITWDEFIEQFKPVQNHLDNNANLNGWMYETFGKEVDYICQFAEKHPDRVWTYIDGDGCTFITSGIHFVNRMGYIITELPYSQITDVIDEDDYYEDEDGIHEFDDE